MEAIAPESAQRMDARTPDAEASAIPRPFWNPYAAGVGLGLTLLFAFFASGHGLGASGGLTRCYVAVLQVVAPAYAAGHPYWGLYSGGRPVLADWLVFEILGVLIGGFVGALTARRIKVEVVRGPRCSARRRMMLAFAGGILVGFAGRLARGCTSGQALTGGATLAIGSWAFMMSVFAGGYAAAWFVRRQWR